MGANGSHTATTRETRFSVHHSTTLEMKVWKPVGLDALKQGRKKLHCTSYSISYYFLLTAYTLFFFEGGGGGECSRHCFLKWHCHWDSGTVPTMITCCFFFLTPNCWMLGVGRCWGHPGVYLLRNLVRDCDSKFQMLSHYELGVVGLIKLQLSQRFLSAWLGNMSIQFKLISFFWI